MWGTIEKIFPYAIVFTIPLLITALGALYSERSGIVNVGLDGIMIVGSFTSAIVISKLQLAHTSTTPLGTVGIILAGLICAMLAGLVFSLLHGFASITLNANQVISGTALNLIATAVTVFLARTITGSGKVSITLGIVPSDIPVLSKIPVIGPLFFTRTYYTTWIVLVILILSIFIINKTRFGLRLRACGEHPHAADAAGINVRRIRYKAVMISGAFAGLGGAIILVTTSGQFIGDVNGLGFLALAALIFGQWRPLGILGATLFFGLAMTFANISSVMPSLSSIPSVYLKIFPYVVTLIALVVFSKSSQSPKAAGEPFDPAKR